MNDKTKTILLVKYRALGDSIMGLSTLSYLRSIYPNSKIYYGVRDWTAKLYSEVEISGDMIIPLSINNFSDYIRLWIKLRSLKIDHIHEMHVSGRTKRFFKIFSMFSGVNYTYHDHHKKGTGPVLDQGVNKELIQRDLDGAYTYLGKEGLIPSFLDYTPETKITSTSKGSSIVFGVVATRDTKMWPLQSYVELSNMIRSEFSNIKIKVPLSLSETDLSIKEKLLALDKNNFLEFFHEPLEKLPIFMSKSSLYIGNDTGLKHLAVSCNVKSYTLFGPEPPKEWHPYDSSKHPFFYIDGLECRTRTAHYCGLSTCSSMICLDDISVKKVFETIREDLRKIKMVNDV